ncbi:hypothetical protein AYX15_01840 [Cryptococcus neoformans]|nr:hypothetical protein AYX15_01840 [Cryptococcus neoformans var. grubii]
MHRCMKIRRRCELATYSTRDKKSFHDDWLRVQGQGSGGPMEVKARRWKWKVEKALLSFTARQTGNSERASGAKCQHPRQHAPLPVKNRVAKKL